MQMFSPAYVPKDIGRMGFFEGFRGGFLFVEINQGARWWMVVVIAWAAWSMPMWSRSINPFSYPFLLSSHVVNGYLNLKVHSCGQILTLLLYKLTSWFIDRTVFFSRFVKNHEVDIISKVKLWKLWLSKIFFSNFILVHLPLVLPIVYQLGLAALTQFLKLSIHFSHHLSLKVAIIVQAAHKLWFSIFFPSRVMVDLQIWENDIDHDHHF